jgi:ubiquinone/menaquinone biosynthesis C-methylase UbiE
MNRMTGPLFAFMLAVAMPLVSAHASANSHDLPENRIAVIDFKILNARDANLSETISGAMRDEISKNREYQVLDRAATNGVSIGKKCQIAPYSEQCFVELGQQLKVDKVISGNVVFYNELYYFSFNIIDTHSGKVENIAEEACNEDGMMALARNIASRLTKDRFFFLQQEPRPDWRNTREINDFFRNVLQYAGKDDWQQPETVVDRLRIRPGDAIADIGAGTGYFTRRFSKRTGEKGTVYALDIEKDMVAYVEEMARKEGINNIRALLVPADNPSLPNDSLDMAFLSDVYIVIPDRQNYFKKLRKALKKEGKLIVVDFHKPPDIPFVPFSAIDFGALDIKPEQPENALFIANFLVINHFKNSTVLAGIPYRFRAPREEVIEEITRAGFKLSEEYRFLPYQYFLVFSKQ